MTDPYVGKLTYFRVYSGKLNSGLLRAQRVDRPQGAGGPHPGDARQPPRGRRPRSAPAPSPPLSASSRRTTGDTLCDAERPVVLESIDFPDPVIDVAVEPKTKADQDKLQTALQRLAEEDPTFRVRTNDERPARRSSPAWASCTWRSSSTA